MQCDHDWVWMTMAGDEVSLLQTPVPNPIALTCKSCDHVMKVTIVEEVTPDE